jgi:hypothetical protein
MSFKELYMNKIAEEVISTFIKRVEGQEITDPSTLQPGQVLTTPDGQKVKIIENDITTNQVTVAPENSVNTGGTTPEYPSTEPAQTDNSNQFDVSVTPTTLDQSELADYTIDPDQY